MKVIETTRSFVVEMTESEATAIRNVFGARSQEDAEVSGNLYVTEADIFNVLDVALEHAE